MHQRGSTKGSTQRCTKEGALGEALREHTEMHQRGSTGGALREHREMQQRGSTGGALREHREMHQRQDRGDHGEMDIFSRKREGICFSLTGEADVCGRVVGASSPRGKT